MKLQHILIALAVSTITSHAQVVATTGFESADGFATTVGNTGGIDVTASNDSAVWLSGVVGTQFNSAWTGQKLTGSMSAVLGNSGQWMTVDPAGSDGVSNVTFSWERYTTSTGTFLVQYTTDALDGGETWTTAATINQAGSPGGGWTAENIDIDQAGDVKLRWLIQGSGGVSFDDVTVNDFSLPAVTQLGRVFADHMVLQRNEPVKIYGTDTNNLPISVSFAGQVKNTTTDAQGNWEVTLDAMTANAVGQPLVVTGTSVISITDVLIGEVWLAAGQSNMNWRVNQSSNTPHAGTYPLIRMCNWEGVVTTGSGDVYDSTDFANLTPENFYAGTWQVMDASTVQAQSAVAYFFAHHLAVDLNVPIGIVELGYGGTSTEAFISPAAHATTPQLTEAFERPYACTNLGQWTGVRLFKNVYNNNVSGGNYTHTDSSKPHPHPYAPGFLYYTGISHLEGFTFKGAIWYQGESNAEFTSGKYKINGNRLSDYQTEVMKTLIADWQTAFGKPNFPFHMVQLPRINGSSRTMWAYYREAQARVAKDIDGCELATVMEFGDDGSNVHPANKEPVGERLAAIARVKQYGDSITYSGPVYTSHTVSGNKIILSFDHTGGGLVDNDGALLRNFEISGLERSFVPATATIVGNTIEVTGAGVINPVAVRHAWEMNADVDLYNGDGFSSSSFRTDNWIAAPGRKLRVACIGDSITFGYGISPDSAKYPAQLEQILGTANFEVQNFGHSGAGIYRAANRYDQRQAYTDAIAYAPDVVICNLGINDITEWGAYTQAQFETEYFELVDNFIQSGNVPIFLQWNKIGPLYPGQAFYNDPNVITLNQWIKEAAANTNTVMFDMETPLSGHPEWFPDNIHPNAAGAREIAETTFCVLSGLGDFDGQPAISEILAINTSGMQDEDTDFSDWIELTNVGTSGVCLSNTYLTNSFGNLTQWQFPSSTVIEPGDNLIVFASTKDRAVNAAELHTSFTLPDSGGSLALVAPDGTTILDSLTSFPAQHADISYGFSSSGSVAITTGSALTYHVPVDASLGTTWTATAFDDSSWTAGTTGLGFDTGLITFDGSQIWDAGFQNGWTEANGGGSSEGLTGTTFEYDHSGSGAATTLDGTASTLGGASWSSISSGDWTIEVEIKFTECSAGFALWAGIGNDRVIVEVYQDRVQDNGGQSFNTLNAVLGPEVTMDNEDGAFHTFTISHDSAADRYHVWRDGVLLTPAAGVVYDLAGVDSRLLFGDYSSGSFGNNFDVEIASISYTGELYEGLIQTDVQSAVQGVNPSAYLRVPFSVSSDPAAFTSLDLDIQYDDGFVAYLNGTEVASRNAPASLGWNATATTDRADTEALATENIDLSAHIGLLNQGANVLAIHALNGSSGAERFLIRPVLTPFAPSQTLFFGTPTPDASNGGAETGSLPFETWKSVYGISLDTSDDDGDGLSALMEFATGTSPTNGTSAARPTPSVTEVGVDNYLTISFQVANGLSGLGYTLEYSDDLVTAPIWQTDATPVMISSEDNGDGSSSMTYRLSSPMGNDIRQFLRVNYTYSE